MHEIIEIRVDAKGKLQLVVPSYLLDFSSGVARSITLTKQEFDLLPKPLTNLGHRVQEYVTSKEIVKHKNQNWKKISKQRSQHKNKM
jgi:hypothetical protein